MISVRALTKQWPHVPLGEAVEFLDSMRRPVTAKDRRSGPYPYYGANGQQDSIDEWIFDEPLILLAEDGGHFEDPERGVAYGVAGKCWVNNHAHVLRPRTGFEWGFLKWHLAHYDLAPFITGSTRAKLTKGDAERVVIVRPPLPEQRRIADILDKADAARRKRKEAIALTEELLRSAFLEMFGDPVTNPGRAHAKPLGELAESIDYGVTASAVREPVGPKFLRITDIQDNRVDWDAVPYCRCEPGVAGAAALQPGDVVFARTGATTGKSFLIRSCPEGSVFASYLIRVRPAAAVLPDYLASFFQSEAYWRQIRMMAEGAAQPGVNSTKLGALLVPVPPRKEQERYVSFSAAATRHRELLELAASSDEQLFGSLVQRAFRGELGRA